MPLVGDAAEFAIEYHLQDVCPPYGNLRLWIAGLPLGDFSEAMHMYHGLVTLRACAIRDPDRFHSTYHSVTDLPDSESALSACDISLGEAHDYYELGIFTIVSERCLYFLWREFKFRGSGCPPNEARVSWDTYDHVVLSVTSTIESHFFEQTGRNLFPQAAANTRRHRENP